MHPQIAIYMDTFQFMRELTEIESVSMDASGGRFCSGFDVNSEQTSALSALSRAASAVMKKSG